MKGKRRSFLDRLLGQPKYIALPHTLFVERCADDDMAVRFGRPDIWVADLERLKE